MVDGGKSGESFALSRGDQLGTPDCRLSSRFLERGKNPPTLAMKVTPRRAFVRFNPLNAKLNPICHLLALFGDHCILHVSRIRVNNI